MTLLKKKIRREAKRHNVTFNDLHNAVRAMYYQQADDYFEAELCSDEIITDTTELWEIAGDIVQYGKDTGEYDY